MVILLLGDPGGHEGLLGRHLKARGVSCAILGRRKRHPARRLPGASERAPEGVLETHDGPRSTWPPWSVSGRACPCPACTSPAWTWPTNSSPWRSGPPFSQPVLPDQRNPLGEPPRLGPPFGHKLYAASVATSLGLTTPDSLVTSDPAQIAPFLAAHGDELALKVLTHRSFTTRWRAWTGSSGQSGHRSGIPAYRISISRVYPPVFLQEYVRKRSEIRAYMVGSQVYAVEIFSQEDPETAVDWRRYPNAPDPERTEGRSRTLEMRPHHPPRGAHREAGGPGGPSRPPLFGDGPHRSGERGVRFPGGERRGSLGMDRTKDTNPPYPGYREPPHRGFPGRPSRSDPPYLIRPVSSSRVRFLRGRICEADPGLRDGPLLCVV